MYFRYNQWSSNPGIAFQWRPCLFERTSYSKSRYFILASAQSSLHQTLDIQQSPATLLYEAALQGRSAHSRDPDSFTIWSACAVIVKNKGCDTSEMRRTRAAENSPDRWICFIWGTQSGARPKNDFCVVTEWGNPDHDERMIWSLCLAVHRGMEVSLQLGKEIHPLE